MLITNKWVIYHLWFQTNSDSRDISIPFLRNESLIPKLKKTGNGTFWKTEIFRKMSGNKGIAGSLEILRR